MTLVGYWPYFVRHNGQTYYYDGVDSKTGTPLPFASSKWKPVPDSYPGSSVSIYSTVPILRLALIVGSLPWWD